MSVKLLTEHHLEFLSLKEGYTGSSESTLFKMPHCWKSHVTALISLQMPRIFHVNWFRTDQNGKFLWPGFGENIRVLDWIIRRVHGEQNNAEKSPIGYIPKEGELLIQNFNSQCHTGKCICRFGGIYTYCRYFVDRKW